MFDDVVKFVNGVVGMLVGVGCEVGLGVCECVCEWFGGLDFVSCEEFEVVKVMVVVVCDENDVLKVWFDVIEVKVGYFIV